MPKEKSYRIVIPVEEGSQLDTMLTFLSEEGYGEITSPKSYNQKVIRRICEKVMMNMDFLNEPLHDDLGKKYDEYLKKKKK